MFEWQRHTQEISEVPHYTGILEFIDLRARASETVFCEGLKRQSQTYKSSTQTKPLTWRTLMLPAYCAVLGNTHCTHAENSNRCLRSSAWSG